MPAMPCAVGAAHLIGIAMKKLPAGLDDERVDAFLILAGVRAEDVFGLHLTSKQGISDQIHYVDALTPRGIGTRSSRRYREKQLTCMWSTCHTTGGRKAPRGC